MADLPVAPIIPNIRADSTIFLTAFQQALANSRRQQQLQFAINKLNQQNELSVMKLDMQEKLGDWRHEKDVEALKQNAEKIGDLDTHYRAMDDARNLDRERKELEWDQKWGAKAKLTESAIDMQHELYNIKAKKGSDDYQNQTNLIKDKYADVAGTTEGRRILGPLEAEHNRARDIFLKERTQMRQTFFATTDRQRVAPTVYGKPELWNTEVKGKHILKRDANGHVLAPNTKNPDPNQTITIDDKDWDMLKSQHDRIYHADDQPDLTPKDELDSNKATEFLREAGGDKQKARQLAREQGYTF